MFGLIRRISNSVLPRPDRPWDDDATSNAPKIGRKRRLSSTERDGDEEMDEQSRTKRSRGDTPQTPAPLSTEAASEETGSASLVDSEGVKEVTKGVKEVELEEKENKDEPSVVAAEDVSKDDSVAPESVPLPKEVSGELDDASSIASTPPAGDTEEVEGDAKTEEETEEPSEAAAEATGDDEKETTSAEPVTKSLTEKGQVSI